jgi:hypothetical protein
MLYRRRDEPNDARGYRWRSLTTRTRSAQTSMAVKQLLAHRGLRVGAMGSAVPAVISPQRSHRQPWPMSGKAPF